MADKPPRGPRTQNQADLPHADTTPRRQPKAASAAQHKHHDMAFLAERGLLPQPESLQPSRTAARAA